MRTLMILPTTRRTIALKPNAGPKMIAGPMTKDMKMATGGTKPGKAGVPMSTDGKPPPGGVNNHPSKSAEVAGT